MPQFKENINSQHPSKDENFSVNIKSYRTLGRKSLAEYNGMTEFG